VVSSQKVTSSLVGIFPWWPMLCVDASCVCGGVFNPTLFGDSGLDQHIMLLGFVPPSSG